MDGTISPWVPECPTGFSFSGDMFPPCNGSHSGQTRNKHGALSRISALNPLISNFSGLLRGGFQRLRGFQNYYGAFDFETENYGEMTSTPCLSGGLCGFEPGPGHLFMERRLPGVRESIKSRRLAIANNLDFITAR